MGKLAKLVEKIQGLVEKVKNLRLVAKITLMATIPMLILSVFAILSVESTGSSVGEKLAKQELVTASYAVEMEMDALAKNSVYQMREDKFYRGNVCISDSMSTFNTFEMKTQLVIMFYYGDTCVISTIEDKGGNTVLGETLSPELMEKVLGGEPHFDSKVKIGKDYYYGYYAPLLNTQTSFTADACVFVGREQSKVQDMYMINIISNIIFVAIIFVISATVLVVMLRRIIKQLVVVVERLNHVAEGKLSVNRQSPLMTRSDEIGNIARSIRALVDSFTAIIKRIMDAADRLFDFSGMFSDRFETITEAIANVNTSVDEIANGATSQAGETQHVNEKIINIGNAIEATTENVEILAKSTQKMKDYNRTVNDTLEELGAINAKTQTSVDAVQKQTNATSRSVAEIRSATNMITEIASQTNLLSLNASIEAARAGEHGRGFAVVAEEIRKLADQSKESASKISAVIAELIKNSNNSVEIMKQMSEIMEEQNKHLDTTKKVFGSLNVEIDSVANAVDSITGEVEQLDVLKSDVMNSVESLAAIAEENAASTEETAAAMQELNEIIIECKSRTDEMIEIAEGLKESTSTVTLEGEETAESEEKCANAEPEQEFKAEPMPEQEEEVSPVYKTPIEVIRAQGFIEVPEDISEEPALECLDEEQPEEVLDKCNLSCIAHS